MDPTYIAIDLKSFYASVECMERGLDPLTANLVVADASRTEKTICLAVSPSLKSYGVPGRPRLFEVIQRVEAVNRSRKQEAKRQGCLIRNEDDQEDFRDSSFDNTLLTRDPGIRLDYIIAPPRMRKYMAVSTQIYQIYLRHVAPEDIHIYSIDECFINAAPYLKLYRISAQEFAATLISDVLHETGITATAGIGTNLYLAKVAMDIVAKKMPADRNGVRIAQLDEETYRRTLWTHTPITDFWRVGRGISAKLAAHGLYTMGDIARCSVGRPSDYQNEELLHRLFGVGAELLIDHAWGWEPTTIADIQQYRPRESSISMGQVLSGPYTAEQGSVIIREMAYQLSMDLMRRRLAAGQIVLTIGYDIDNLSGSAGKHFSGTVTTDRYGRNVPKPAHGTIRLEQSTSSSQAIIQKALELYERIIDRDLHIRRIYLVAGHVIPEDEAAQQTEEFEQLDLFGDYEKKRVEKEKNVRHSRLQKTIVDLQKRYGKNAVLQGTSLREEATARERNGQVGGHKG